MHVHFDRRVTDLRLAAALDTPAQWIFDRTVSSGAGQGQYLAVSISGADDYIGARPADLGRDMVEALGALFPAAREAKVLKTFVTREHNATFRASPGSSAHRAPARTRSPGWRWPAPGRRRAGPRPWKALSAADWRPLATVLAATGRRTSLPRGLFVGHPVEHRHQLQEVM